MVTTQGFNALLKIVEEPPEHESEKVLPTIRSRTHYYPFPIDLRVLGQARRWSAPPRRPTAAPREI